MRAALILLGLPLLAAGAHHTQNHAHRHVHALANRALYTEIVTVTEITTITVEASSATSYFVTDGLSASLASSSPVVSLTSVPLQTATNSSQPSTPIEDHRVEPTTIADSTNPYQTLVPVPNSAHIKNSCTYPVHIWSVGHESCTGPGANCTLIAPNATYTEPFRKCTDGGVSLKVSKDQDASKPMQFEYSVWPNEVMVSYDISYLNCMHNENGEKDLSGCAGHDGGVQAVGGGDCPDYHCLAGKWCDRHAYVVAEFDYKPNAPVGGCTVDKGIAFELCAGTRV